MAGEKDTGPNGSSLDLAHFIRSMQRIEGSPDCFGKANSQCDQTECCWRFYCLRGLPILNKKEKDPENNLK
jgi:hypothetical protein